MDIMDIRVITVIKDITDIMVITDIKNYAEWRRPQNLRNGLDSKCQTNSK